MTDEQIQRLEEVASQIDNAVDRFVMAVENIPARSIESAATTMANAASRMSDAAGTMYMARR